jgi:hypothetical protein
MWIQQQRRTPSQLLNFDNNETQLAEMPIRFLLKIHASTTGCKQSLAGL